MVWKQLLLISAVAVLTISGTGIDSAIAAPKECNRGTALFGHCKVHGSIGKGSVDIGGTATTPGGPASGGGGDGDVAPAAPSDLPQPGDPLYHAPFGVINPVTIRQLRRFHPNPGTDYMQPDGWVIVGLATNFYSNASTQLLHGRLLGKPVVVRFTPVGWHWNYGDGTTAARATAGASWRALDILEFDPTPTSHAYAHKGTYYIGLGVEFAAEYKFAHDDWTPVTGTLTVPANRLKATAGSATTVLVDRDCTQNPTGPGC